MNKDWLIGSSVYSQRTPQDNGLAYEDLDSLTGPELWNMGRAGSFEINLAFAVNNEHFGDLLSVRDDLRRRIIRNRNVAHGHFQSFAAVAIRLAFEFTG